MKTTYALATLCAGAALLAACNRGAPSGQVAATVNGDEITLQEINTELQSAQIPPGADKKAVQRALLQRIVERKLLIDAAEEKKLDKTPDFLAQRRRMDELLLTQTYARQQLASVPVPTAADIAKFIADHPNVYGGRELLTLDQIRFPAPKTPAPLEAMAQDHSMAAVAARLDSLGIRYERGTNTLDTANVPPQVLAQLRGLPPTEPFVVPQPGIVTVNIITGRRPVATDATVARQTATQAWRQQKFADVLQQQLNALKAGAKISYQNGFGPPAAPSNQPAPAARPAAPAAR